MSKLRIDVSILGATAAASSHYYPAPFRCTVRGLDLAPNADPGDAETVTVKKGSDSVGVLTFGTDIAAGASGTYVSDTTNGHLVFNEGDNIILEISQLTAVATFNGSIKIDPFAAPE